MAVASGIKRSVKAGPAGAARTSPTGCGACSRANKKGRLSAALRRADGQPTSVGIFSNSCVVNVTISCSIQLPENRIAAPTPTAFGTNDNVAS